MEKKLFGYMPDGCAVYSYTMKNGKMEAEIVSNQMVNILKMKN